MQKHFEADAVRGGTVIGFNVRIQDQCQSHVRSGARCTTRIRSFGEGLQEAQFRGPIDGSVFRSLGQVHVPFVAGRSRN